LDSGFLELIALLHNILSIVYFFLSENASVTNFVSEFDIKQSYGITIKLGLKQRKNKFALV
jgi:hypothetical protein